MQNQETSLILAGQHQLPTFSISDSAKQAKELALQKSALIGAVKDRDSKIIAVRAQQDLKACISAIEKARKQLKEPLLQAGRQLDTLCAAESLELEKEFGRVSNAVRVFDDAERARVAEEERLQRLELERIERERQAELKRIADEQAAREAEVRRVQEEAERKAREAAAEAARLAAEATTKKERAAAAEAKRLADEQAAKAEAERLRVEADLRRQQEEAAAKTAAIEDRASNAAFCTSRPVEITRVEGQRTRSDWEITRISEFVLSKARPDLVRKIEFDMLTVKDELRRGVKLPGVEAREVFTAGVKLPKQREVINV